LWVGMEQRQVVVRLLGRSVQRETQNNKLSVKYPHALTKKRHSPDKEIDGFCWRSATSIQS